MNGRCLAMIRQIGLTLQAWSLDRTRERELAEAWNPHRPRKLELVSFCPSVSDSVINATICVDSQMSEMTGTDVDWEAEGVERPNDTAKAKARIVLTFACLAALPIVYVTASATGGVVVCFSRGETYIDLECFNSGEIWGVISEHSKHPETWLVESTSGIEEAVKLIKTYLSRKNA